MLFESELPHASPKEIEKMFAQVDATLSEANMLKTEESFQNKLGRMAMKWVLAFGNTRYMGPDLRS